MDFKCLINLSIAFQVIFPALIVGDGFSTLETFKKASEECESYAFNCESDGHCVDFDSMCDGVEDCIDGSDEFGCGEYGSSVEGKSTSINEDYFVSKKFNTETSESGLDSKIEKSSTTNLSTQIVTLPKLEKVFKIEAVFVKNLSDFDEYVDVKTNDVDGPTLEDYGISLDSLSQAENFTTESMQTKFDLKATDDLTTVLNEFENQNYSTKRPFSEIELTEDSLFTEIKILNNIEKGAPTKSNLSTKKKILDTEKLLPTMSLPIETKFLEKEKLLPTKIPLFSKPKNVEKETLLPTKISITTKTEKVSPSTETKTDIKKILTKKNSLPTVSSFYTKREFLEIENLLPTECSSCINKSIVDSTNISQNVTSVMDTTTQQTERMPQYINYIPETGKIFSHKKFVVFSTPDSLFENIDNSSHFTEIEPNIYEETSGIVEKNLEIEALVNKVQKPKLTTDSNIETKNLMHNDFFKNIYDMEAMDNTIPSVYETHHNEESTTHNIDKDTNEYIVKNSTDLHMHEESTPMYASQKSKDNINKEEATVHENQKSTSQHADKERTTIFAYQENNSHLNTENANTHTNTESSSHQNINGKNTVEHVIESSTAPYTYKSIKGKTLTPGYLNEESTKQYVDGELTQIKSMLLEIDDPIFILLTTTNKQQNESLYYETDHFTESNEIAELLHVTSYDNFTAHKLEDHTNSDKNISKSTKHSQSTASQSTVSGNDIRTLSENVTLAKYDELTTKKLELLSFSNFTFDSTRSIVESTTFQNIEFSENGKTSFTRDRSPVKSKTIPAASTESILKLNAFITEESENLDLVFVSKNVSTKNNSVTDETFELLNKPTDFNQFEFTTIANTMKTKLKTKELIGDKIFHLINENELNTLNDSKNDTEQNGQENYEDYLTEFIIENTTNFAPTEKETSSEILEQSKLFENKSFVVLENYKPQFNDKENITVPLDIRYQNETLLTENFDTENTNGIFIYSTISSNKNLTEAIFLNETELTTIKINETLGNETTLASENVKESFTNGIFIYSTISSNKNLTEAIFLNETELTTIKINETLGNETTLASENVKESLFTETPIAVTVTEILNKSWSNQIPVRDNLSEVYFNETKLVPKNVHETIFTKSSFVTENSIMHLLNETEFSTKNINEILSETVFPTQEQSTVFSKENTSITNPLNDIFLNETFPNKTDAGFSIFSGVIKNVKEFILNEISFPTKHMGENYTNNAKFSTVNNVSSITENYLDTTISESQTATSQEFTTNLELYLNDTVNSTKSYENETLPLIVFDEKTLDLNLNLSAVENSTSKDIYSDYFENSAILVENITLHDLNTSISRYNNSINFYDSIISFNDSIIINLLNTISPTSVSTPLTTTTTVKSTTTSNPCILGEFFCRIDLMCIPVEWRCDQTDDCWDGSDERNCDAVVCPSDRMQCPDTGQCIFESWVCDGTPDCEGGSDEMYC